MNIPISNDGQIIIRSKLEQIQRIKESLDTFVMGVAIGKEIHGTFNTDFQKMEFIIPDAQKKSKTGRKGKDKT